MWVDPCAPCEVLGSSVAFVSIFLTFGVLAGFGESAGSSFDVYRYRIEVGFLA